MPRKPDPKLCACGCGQMTKGGKFIPGHDTKVYRAILQHIGGDIMDLKDLVEAHSGDVVVLDDRYVDVTEDRTDFLMIGRRLPEAFTHYFNDGGGREAKKWAVERPHFEHVACGIYLAGCLAFLEGRYKPKGEPAPWNRPGVRGENFDVFVEENANFVKAQVSECGLDALICIRNAFTHNYNDLAGNRDNESLEKVEGAAIKGVHLEGSVVSLDGSFMEYVRLAFVAVTQYHGDG